MTYLPSLINEINVQKMKEICINALELRNDAILLNCFSFFAFHFRNFTLQAILPLLTTHSDVIIILIRKFCAYFKNNSSLTISTVLGARCIDTIQLWCKRKQFLNNEELWKWSERRKNPRRAWGGIEHNRTWRSTCRCHLLEMKIIKNIFLHPRWPSCKWCLQ